MRPPIASIQAGKIQGIWQEKNQIAVFKGVPYAQAPIGSLRWRAPQPLQKWSGIKNTTKFSSAAWQQEMMIGEFLVNLVNGQGWGWLRTRLINTLLKVVPVVPKQSEDCLYLNIRSPQFDEKAKLPVMVWIHGGDHQDGSASEPYYDGNAIPKKGVVTVTINYRLGLMGYFAHPELTEESEHQVSGNYGTLDQIAALQWVKDNIAAFGGDPDNVTIFGESAGGESVAHMLSSPLAKGLFHKAILQSPANSGQMMHLSKPFLDYDSAEERGIQFAAQAGVSGTNQLSQLRSLSAKALKKIVQNQTVLSGFYPVIDTYVLPKSPFEAFHDGDQAKVPILLGSNADEATLLHPIFPTPLIEHRLQTMSPNQLPEVFYTVYAAEADKLLTLYPGLQQRNVAAETAFLGDVMFGSKVRFYAEYATKAGQAAYYYFFKRVPPSSKQTVGAFHASELPFVHGTSTPILPLDDADKQLSVAMVNYWTQFAKTGNPNDNGLVAWEAFDPNHPHWMVFNKGKIGMEKVEREEKYQLLNQRTLRHIEAMKILRDKVSV